MRKVTGIVIALVMITGFCVSCGKTEQPKAEPEVTEQPKASEAKTWEPETAAPVKEHKEDDGHDHSGHGHKH
ncbi:hypothetical protein ACFLS1_04495 [Verrucomicrobiota bacterium]